MMMTIKIITPAAITIVTTGNCLAEQFVPEYENPNIELVQPHPVFVHIPCEEQFNAFSQNRWQSVP